MPIHNDNQQLIGSFCINMDISYMTEVQKFFDSFAKCAPVEVIGVSEGFFPKSAEEEIQSAIHGFLFENAGKTTLYQLKKNPGCKTPKAARSLFKKMSCRTGC